MSFIFDLITSPLGLPVHWLIEYIVLGVIGVLAYKIGWGVSEGGFGGSFIHWAVRTVTFVIMWAIAYALCDAGQFIYNLI